jgi:hypothetical protein
MTVLTHSRIALEDGFEMSSIAAGRSFQTDAGPSPAS